MTDIIKYAKVLLEKGCYTGPTDKCPTFVPKALQKIKTIVRKLASQHRKVSAKASTNVYNDTSKEDPLLVASK